MSIVLPPIIPPPLWDQVTAGSGNSPWQVQHQTLSPPWPWTRTAKSVPSALSKSALLGAPNIASQGYGRPLGGFSDPSMVLLDQPSPIQNSQASPLSKLSLAPQSLETKPRLLPDLMDTAALPAFPGWLSGLLFAPCRLAFPGSPSPPASRASLTSPSLSLFAFLFTSEHFLMPVGRRALVASSFRYLPPHTKQAF